MVCEEERATDMEETWAEGGGGRVDVVVEVPEPEGEGREPASVGN